MDMLCADITDIAHAGVGSNVTLWGDAVSVDEVAKAAGTVGYELLCAISQRVPMMEV
jgi:alanine racemase